MRAFGQRRDGSQPARRRIIGRVDLSAVDIERRFRSGRDRTDVDARGGVVGRRRDTRRVLYRTDIVGVARRSHRRRRRHCVDGEPERLRHGTFIASLVYIADRQAMRPLRQG